MIALPPPDLNLPIYGACMGMNGYVGMHVWMYVWCDAMWILGFACQFLHHEGR